MKVFSFYGNELNVVAFYRDCGFDYVYEGTECVILQKKNGFT